MKNVEIVTIDQRNEKAVSQDTGVHVDTRMGPAFYGEVDGRIIFVCGHTSPWKGLAEAWLVPLPGFYQCLDAPRKIARLNEVIAIRYGVKRLQACIDSTNERNVRFMEYLGFHKEHELKDYGPHGQPFVIMRR